MEKKTNGLGIASMVIGIISLLISCCYGGFLGIVGLILGIIAVRKPRNGTAIAGIITSGIALFITLFMLIAGMGSLGDYIEKSKESSTENITTESSVNSTDAVSSTDTASSDTESTQEDIIEIGAEELCVSYDENEVNCKNLYEEKTLRVSGIIEDIGIDILDDQYIILYGGSYDQTYVTIQCYFQEDVDISSLSKGASITVVGTYENGVLSPTLHECTIE